MAISYQQGQRYSIYAFDSPLVAARHGHLNATISLIRLESSTPQVMNSFHRLLFCGASLLVPSAAMADTAFVSFGPSTGYVTAMTNAQGLVNGGVAFSMTAARNPLVGPDYSTAPGNAIFFGGAVSSGTNGAGKLGTWRMHNNDSINGAGNDTFELGLNAVDSVVGQSATGLILWKQTNFRGGSSFTGGNVVASSLAFRGKTNAAGTSGTTGAARFVIQRNNSTYIISAVRPYNTTLPGTPVTLSNLSSVAWYSYNPASSITAIGAQVTPSFDYVTAVGLFFQVTRTASGGSTPPLFATFERFSATGSVKVPHFEFVIRPGWSQAKWSAYYSMLQKHCKSTDIVQYFSPNLTSSVATWINSTSGIANLPCGLQGVMLSGFSIDACNSAIAFAKSNGYGWIQYDLEKGDGYSPEEETKNPLASIQTVSNAVRAAGLKFQLTVANVWPLLAGQVMVDAAPYCDRILQQGVMPIRNNDQALYEANVSSYIPAIRQSNPNCLVLLEGTVNASLTPAEPLTTGTESYTTILGTQGTLTEWVTQSPYQTNMGVRSHTMLDTAVLNGLAQGKNWRGDGFLIFNGGYCHNTAPDGYTDQVNMMDAFWSHYDFK